MLLENRKELLVRRASALLAIGAGTLAGLGFTAVHRGHHVAASPGPKPDRKAIVAPPTGFRPLASLVTTAPAQPKPKQPKPKLHAVVAAARATVSLYEGTADARVLRRQGCTAGK